MTRHVFLVCACVAQFAAPTISAAQQQVFVEGLSELTDAVAGTYGDEGRLIGPALNKMAAGLSGWDRSIQALENRARTELPTAVPGVASRIHATLAGMYAQRGRLSEASREIDAAIGLESGRADLHLLRGAVLDASDRSAEAGDAVRAAWALEPTDPIKAYYLVSRHRTSGAVTEDDLLRARAALMSAYRMLLDERARDTAAPFTSVGLFEESAGQAPVLPLVAYVPGYTLISRGRYEEALAEFRRAASIDPLTADPASRSVSLVPAVAALRQGRLGDARALLERFDVLQESSEAHRILGLVHWADSEYDRSIEDLNVAIRLNPRDERSRLALSRVLSSAGRDPEAERALIETLEIHPDSPLARWWLGMSHDRSNRFAEARREFERIAPNVVLGRSAFFAAIGRLAAAAGDFPGAADAFARAVRSSPNDPAHRRSLAGALLQQDLPDDAFAELVAALLIDPKDAHAHAFIGRIDLDAGRYEDAVRALTRAVELLPGHLEARYALATALVRAGKTQEAAREFERVEQAQRQRLADRRHDISLDVLKEEAALRFAEGSYDRAATLWQQAIDREPGRPANHLGLAAALAHAGRIDAAITQCEIAAMLGADPAAFRQLADLYAKVGRVEDASRAKVMYEKALRGELTGRGTDR